MYINSPGQKLVVQGVLQPPQVLGDGLGIFVLGLEVIQYLLALALVVA